MQTTRQGTVSAGRPHRAAWGPSVTLEQALEQRTSVRAYTGEHLGEAVVRRLLEAAVRAPTAMHLEPWAFVVVQDPALLARYSARAKALMLQIIARTPDPKGTHYRELLASPSFDIFHGAGTLVVICGYPTSPYVAADCWLAAENLMLAAFGEGLGTCCIGFALPLLALPDVKAELGIPPEVIPVAAIVVGVPTQKVAPSPRKRPEILAWKRAEH